MTTAHWLRAGAAGAGGGGAMATLGGSKVTVRSSWRVTPAASVAVTTIALVPARSVSGVVTTTEVWGVRSVWSATATPFRLTCTRATPLRRHHRRRDGGFLGDAGTVLRVA